MRAGRRALGELLAAIIVALAVTSLAVAFAETADRAADSISVAGRNAEESLVDASYPPTLSVALNGSTLYLMVYPQRPIEVGYIIYTRGGHVYIRDLGMLIANATRIAVDEGYDCEPASLMLVTRSGVAIPYSPARDPGVLEAAYAGRWDLLRKTGIDCDLLDAVENASQAGGSARQPEGLLVGSSSAFHILYMDPASVGLTRGNNYTITVLDLRVAGMVSSYRVSLGVNLSVGGVLLGRASLNAVYPNHPLDLEYMGSIEGDQGQTVGVYAAAYCGSGACVAGIYFDSGTPTVYSGRAYVSMSFSTDISGGCQFSGNTLVAPALIGQLSSYKAVVKGECKPSSVGVSPHQEWGYTNFGSYATTGPLILLYSNMYADNLKLNATVWLSETDIISGGGGSYRLPCRGPVEYWLIPYKVSPANPLSGAIMGIYNYSPPNPLLRAYVNGSVVTRVITSDHHVLPLEGVEYEAVIPPLDTLTFSTRLGVDYGTRSLPYGWIGYEWNITATYTPQPFLLPTPYLVAFKCVETGEEYILAAPQAGSPAVRQGGMTYRGLAAIIGGIEAYIEPGTSGSANYSYYTLQLEGDPDSSLEAPFNILGGPTPLNPTADGGYPTPQEPTTILVIRAPAKPGEDPQLYGATIVRVY